MKEEKYSEDGVFIVARSISIGKFTTFGYNVSIELNGDFVIGDHSHIGDDVVLRGNNVTIGNHFYHSKGLRVGGGGKNGPNANLTIGDRCTMHNNFINVCQPVFIGHDVGLSEEVSIITHGYWQSVLEGYPRRFAGVTIGSGVIVGYRSVILPGATIAANSVIGANSTVTKALKTKGIYAGNPAKFIKPIEKPDKPQEVALAILRQYAMEAGRLGYDPNIDLKFPEVTIDDFTVNLLTFDYMGEEDETTDHFRDFVRHWGIRIYTERPFS